MADREERRELRVNEQIRVPKVLVINENGQKIGVMETRDAIRLARSKGLDLIEVAPHARPPACRIMDYGKFKYQQQKRGKEARKHHKELKEIRLTPQMSEHDLLYRVKNTEEFLRDGHRVRVFMQITGRWAAHTELGEMKLREFVNHLSHVSTIETPLTRQGRIISTVLAPRKDSKQKQVPPAKTEKPAPTAQLAQPEPKPETQQEIVRATDQETPQAEQPKVIEVSSDEG